MKKRVLVAAASLLVSLALSASAYLYTNRTLRDLLSAAEAAWRTGADAAALAEDFEAARPLLAALLDTPQGEALSLSFFALELTDPADDAAYREALRGVIAALRGAAEAERMKKENIF